MYLLKVIRSGVLLWSGSWHGQVSSGASKDNRILGLMKNTFISWSDEIARIIYQTLIRPHCLLHQSGIRTQNSTQKYKKVSSNHHHLPFEKSLERPYLTDLKKYERECRFHLDLQDGLENVNWCDENRTLRTNQKLTD